MKVNKFGGASVKDAGGIRNLTAIIRKDPGKMVVVVSAFGKTTNALEQVLSAWFRDDENYLSLLNNICNEHNLLIDELLPGKESVRAKIDISFAGLKEKLLAKKRGEYDFEYDQIVSYGEIWSTIIVAEYLKTVFSDVEWIDIRENLLTDDRFRDANILME